MTTTQPTVARVAMISGAGSGIGLATALAFAREGVILALTHFGEVEAVEELQAHARSKLANYKIPKRFHICEALPQTVVGKIDKPRLKKFAAEGRDDLAALRG